MQRGLLDLSSFFFRCKGRGDPVFTDRGGRVKANITLDDLIGRALFQPFIDKAPGELASQGTFFRALTSIRRIVIMLRTPSRFMIQFHHPILNLFLRVPGGDVLRTIPVEGLDLDDKTALDTGLVAVYCQLA